MFGLDNVRETVAVETPAARATSWMVEFFSVVTLHIAQLIRDQISL